MPERSTGAMMFIGERCAFDECHREDFLPFKCADCRESFCGSHFRPASHRCTKHDDSSGDYRVPLCPLCDTPPEGWKRDEDPNIAMDRHLSSGKCPALDANGLVKNRTSSSKATAAPAIHAKKPNKCAFKKCSKVMVVPIQCPQCRSSFCPSHRAPAQHSCGSSPSASSTRLAPSSSSASKSSGAASALKKFSPSLGNGSSKPSDQTPQAQKPSPVAALTNKAASSKLFDKTDKRAKAERVSAIKAMQARQKKGLLTKTEELKLAEEMAEMAKISNGKKDSDCVVC